MTIQTYETFRESIEAKWIAAQRSRDLAAQRLYERVLFRLVDQPDVALAHLAEQAQGTADPEVRAW